MEGLDLDDQREDDESTMLIRAIESVLRRLIQLLIGKISLTKFQQLVRVVFIEEAQRAIQRDAPDERVSLSSLGLLTGLDTRTLSKFVKELGDPLPVTQRRTVVRDLTPECALVENWTRLEPFLDESGHPRELTIEGRDSEFEDLFRASVTTRGITPSSLLKTLEATNTIEFVEEGEKVRLLRDKYSPFLSTDTSSRLVAGLHAIVNLASTVKHNLNLAPDDRNFQRESWTYRLDPHNKEALRKHVKKFLESLDSEMVSSIGRYEEPQQADDQYLAGVGVYYFCEAMNPAVDED